MAWILYSYIMNSFLWIVCKSIKCDHSGLVQYSSTMEYIKKQNTVIHEGLHKMSSLWKAISNLCKSRSKLLFDRLSQKIGRVLIETVCGIRKGTESADVWETWMCNSSHNLLNHTKFAKSNILKHHLMSDKISQALNVHCSAIYCPL